MLTPLEKILFVVAAVVSLLLTARGFDRMRRVIERGRGRLGLDRLPARVAKALVDFLSQRTVLKARLGPSIFHALVAWGFTYYVLVNTGDLLEGFIPGFVFLGRGTLGDVYRLVADVLSAAVLIGIVALAIRRLLFGRTIFGFLPRTPVRADVPPGMTLDAAIVFAFIVVHVGARFFGASTQVAANAFDPWQPFAGAFGRLWRGVSPGGLAVMRHAGFWVALGTILLFLPYFPRSKHLHLILAPVNILTKPRRRSIGALDPIDFEDESAGPYGAAKLEQLSRSQLVDTYACIQCNRCQDVCPGHVTGKALSPSALEINKRYFANEHVAELAAGKESDQELIAFAISGEALWACTACGACIEICPVGNEPMRDILDIRRSRVLMESDFPEPLQTAYRGMERSGNPWGFGADQRVAWCADLGVPTVDDAPDAELVWWVGCAPATDARAQRTARAFARILQTAGVRFAILGARERCTGDPARRSGNEYLFATLARQNVATLDAVRPKRIVVTCPHCLHTLRNEYPDFGGRYEVVHHTELIAELVRTGRLALSPRAMKDVAFHDPCYLGRHNGVYDEPREALRGAGVEVTELPRRRNRSFCCGAGGAQVWKEEEPGRERVSTARFREVRAAGAKTLAVGCPFCMIMLTDASNAAGGEIPVRDVAEIVADAIGR